MSTARNIYHRRYAAARAAFVARLAEQAARTAARAGALRLAPATQNVEYRDYAVVAVTCMARSDVAPVADTVWQSSAPPDGYAGGAVFRLHQHARIGEPVTIAIATAGPRTDRRAAPRVRAVLIDVGAALHPAIDQRPHRPRQFRPGQSRRWSITCTLTGAIVCGGASRLDAIDRYRRMCRDTTATGGDWLGSRLLEAAALRLRHPARLGGEVAA